jgi:hypothetical protein
MSLYPFSFLSLDRFNVAMFDLGELKQHRFSGGVKYMLQVEYDVVYVPWVECDYIYGRMSIGHGSFFSCVVLWFFVRRGCVQWFVGRGVLFPVHVLV